MSEHRLSKHPILPPPEGEPTVPFYFNGERQLARPGEMISTALFASGIHVFGHHPRDGAPLGIFCANGQCAQCTVVANGVAVKSCMVPVEENMVVESCDRAPALPVIDEQPTFGKTVTEEVDVLVIGAGPAGLSAAIEFGKLGMKVLVVDDKDRPGGKLVLQTHKFFGSIEDTKAGTRGIDIADELAAEMADFENVELRLLSTAVGVFSDGKIGVVREGHYFLVEPKGLLVATGAREKQIPFPGRTLPGVYGAGAFQTLLNRDLVTPCKRLFVLGGGNVGLIAAYHALQADLEVVGLAEAMPRVGGYQVHADKIKRLGVPLYTSHTVLAAHGEEHVEGVTIAQVNEKFEVIEGTERSFEVDTLLVAVGLSALDDFIHQAREFGMKIEAAGDAEEIAEASAATFGGRIGALQAGKLGMDVPEVPKEWEEKLEVLKARPGDPVELTGDLPDLGVYPVIRCTQEIPCNPCATVCKKHSIEMQGDPILGRPEFIGPECTGCTKCVTICPGLAITMVDGRKDPDFPIVSVPFEQSGDRVAEGAMVLATDQDGNVLGNFEVVGVKNRKFADRTLLVQIRSPREMAPLIAGIRMQNPEELMEPVALMDDGSVPDDTIICRCEHVTAGEIRESIKSGTRDLNEMKAELRVCMGACCGKNCPEHLSRLFREMGVEAGEVTSQTIRPLFVEVPFGVFAQGSEEKK